MQYGLSVLTPPASEPVTLAQIKDHLGMSDQFVRDDPYLIDQLLPQARREFEQFTNRALITTKLQLTIDYQLVYGQSTQAFYLPRNPVEAVQQIDWLDEDGNYQIIDTADYVLVNDREPAIVELDYGKSWPSRANQRASLRIQYDAGYGLTGADVPPEINGCVLRLIETYYRFRGQGEIPETLYFAMENFRVGDEFLQYDIGTARGIIG